MIREKIVLVINLFYLFLFFGCTHKEIIYSKKINENVLFEKVHINELLENIEKYDNKYIEVIGVFHMDLENVYIGYDHVENRLWLDINPFNPLKKGNLNLFDYELYQHRDKKVKVKGLLKTSISGHLWYRAGITNISEFIVNPKK